MSSKAKHRLTQDARHRRHLVFARGNGIELFGHSPNRPSVESGCREDSPSRDEPHWTILSPLGLSSRPARPLFSQRGRS